MSLPARIAAALVAGEGLELYMGEHMGLEAIRTGARRVATNPGALKNESGSPLPGRRRIVFRNNISDPLDIREPLDIAGTDGQLGLLVGDCAAKYFAPLVSGE